jgi:hypothetical protein
MLNFEQLNKFYNINQKTIFDKGSPWAKFILLPQNDPRRENIRQALLIHPNIKNTINRLGDPDRGINSLSRTPADYRIYGSFYWVLRFLADIGLTAEELGISELIKKLQLRQLEDGQFIVRYHRKKQQPISLVCMTAQLTYCLVRLGYEESNIINAALNFILTTQRLDDGWHCDRLKQTGEQDESASSCPVANIHVIRLLGQYGKKYKALIKPAIEQFVRICDFSSLPNCEFDAQQVINLNKLRYPPHYTGLDILNMIHSLSFFPDLVVNTNFESLINLILNRWDGKNWLRPEKRIPEWLAYDFSQKSRYSEWLTSLLVQALERVYFKN